jgi:hypothetical protein
MILFFTLSLWISCGSRVDAASETAPEVTASEETRQGTPSIQVAETVFDFGEVMEGSEVVHEFIVGNEGKGVLRIEQVRLGCGCTAARFDREVSGGGAGRVTLKLNTSGYEGTVKKAATVFTNDPRQPRVVLTMQGMVRTFIKVQPSSSISFRGPAHRQSPRVVELTGSQAFHIQNVESSLEGMVRHEIEPMASGKGYRVKVENILKQGSYSGSIMVTTDVPQKPRILIRVIGSIEGDIAVRPPTTVIGRISVGQPVRQGIIRVVSNRGSPFKITRLTYDQELVQVVQKPMEGEPGYALEISPIMENIPAGSRRNMTLSIETDAEPSARCEVQIFLVHSRDSAPSEADRGRVTPSGE